MVCLDIPLMAGLCPESAFGFSCRVLPDEEVPYPEEPLKQDFLGKPFESVPCLAGGGFGFRAYFPDKSPDQTLTPRRGRRSASPAARTYLR